MFNTALPSLSPKRLAVKLSVSGERSLRQGHPWIFSNSIDKVSKAAEAGDLAIIFGTRSNEVIGVGLFDPKSPIRIKMLHHNGPATVNSDFFTERIQAAYELRKPLFKTQTDSYRLIFGENDRLPGLIADVYAKVAVVKLYSAVWLPYLKEVLENIQTITNCEAMVLRLNRKLQNEATGLSDGQVIWGELESEDVQFTEHGTLFLANVVKGHKTGYFLDHRHNRKRVGEMARGKTVLDVFSYAGGFSVHALVNGAKEVTSLDISEQALEMAEKNARLNPYKGTHVTIAGDAFSLLKDFVENNRKFDLVVIDPPSFAKSEKEVSKAIKKYETLAYLGAKLTDVNGTLVLASCSSRVSSEQFFEANKKGINASGRNFKLADTTAHDIDHPVSFNEGSYLKTAYYICSD